MTMAQFALRWIQMNSAVTCSIPGAKRPDQVEQNAVAADFPAISQVKMAAVQKIYKARVRPVVQAYW
jgi:aryl-alcohol dehydrogenase-like predicted oxidoreductase